MAKHEGLVLLTLLSLAMLAIPAQVQASEFATYNNLLFKIYYPSGWTVNQTGTVKQGNVTFVENGTRPPQGAAMAVNETGTVKQGNVTFVENATWPPQAAAMARVSWLPENMSMNSDLSHHEAHGWVTTMINNDSYYLLGQRALVIDQTDGYNKQLTFATNVNGTTYEVSYVATIDHFLNHISQFNVMVASFNIHGHVPKLKASTSSQESNKTSSSQESNKTSSSQESNKTSSSQESSNTGNGATSPTSSYQAVKTPYVSKTGATKTVYRAQGASNGKKRTELTISATQTGPARPQEENNATGEIFTLVPVTLSGRLTSEGSGVKCSPFCGGNSSTGAEVVFHCDDGPCNGVERTNTGAHVTQSSSDTDSGGHYSVVVL